MFQPPAATFDTAMVSAASSRPPHQGFPLAPHSSYVRRQDIAGSPTKDESVTVACDAATYAPLSAPPVVVRPLATKTSGKAKIER